MEKSILVFDFGGQYAHLIANRIRRCGAHSDIVNNDISVEEVMQKNPAGIVFSGGPHSVYEKNAPLVDKKILELGVPVLGICYGHQIIAQVLGGKVEGSPVHEFGKADFSPKKNQGIFENLPEKSTMWMSHGDHVSQLPSGFEIAGTTDDCEIAAMADFEKNIFGIQFHPEVTHSDKGMDILKNFIRVCGVENSWNMNNFLESEIAKIQKQCEGKKVFLLVSGGVDSSVCFALLQKALGKDRVFGCLIDHGMMRKNESEEVKKMLLEAGFEDLHIEKAEKFFLEKLSGVTAPEEKRKIIGDAFLSIQAKVASELGLDGENWLLAQGTIYPDTIESGGTQHSSKIKTHHNRVEAIAKLIEEGKIVEPIAELYKDEVREVGKELGLSEKLVGRHPFPGPGLGVRILCTHQKDELKNAKTVEEEIEKKFGVAASILPIRSVGVQGDGRSYRHPCVLFLPLPQVGGEGRGEGGVLWDFLEKTARDISNAFPLINRVLLCLSHTQKPENSAEIVVSEMTKDRIAVLQEADAIVRNEIVTMKDAEKIWQFPVVLAPVGWNAKESIILRPIESENAMTASCARLDFSEIKILSDKILSSSTRLEAVFYDLTHKPPGTIEWE